MTAVLKMLLWEWIIPIYSLSLMIAYVIWVGAMLMLIDDYRREKRSPYPDDVSGHAAKVVHYIRHWWYPVIWFVVLYKFIVRGITEAKEDAKQ